MVSGAWSKVLMPTWFVCCSSSINANAGSTLGGVPVHARFPPALDGKAGRDQQQSNGGEVTDINAVRRSERDQDRSFRERFKDHEPDGYGGQREGLEPAAAANTPGLTGSMPGARHSYDRSTHLSPSHGDDH